MRSILFILLLVSTTAISQITNSKLSGTVKDTKGEPVPFANILITYSSTGTKYGAASDIDGVFRIYNANPGGPYDLVATSVGYKTVSKSGLYLQLGDNELALVLEEDAQELEAVVVTGSANKPQSSVTINEKSITTVPTISRALTDFTKLVPQSVNNSFAGTNFRYNNVTIDGTINNDAIGFSPSLGGQTGTSGMPGSSTRTSPISLDAIKDIQVYLAPYDVKIGNFLGGSINAITRSGTNNLEGSVYAFGRNYALTGFKTTKEFNDGQTGFRIGLPIIKDKLFFFTNEEVTYRREPVFYGANSDGLVDDATAKAIADFTKAKYGYNAGEWADYSIYSKSTKFFNRVDWNINDKHQLTIRNNTTISEATNLERDAANFRFSSQDFRQNARQNSNVLELRSHGKLLSNSLVLGYTRIRDWRTPLSEDVSFPQTEISYNGGTIFIGNEREATIFNLKQRTLEITDNLNFSLGKHSLLIGTHNELYKIDYGFVNSWNGRIAYKSLADYYAGKVNRVRGFYGIENNDRDYIFSNPYAQFNINLFSLYAQDEIQLGDLKLTGGLRADYSQLPNKPKLSQEVPAQYTNQYLDNINLSPRLGFNWTKESVTVRGGTGAFVGRIPFAWIGYAYYNDGVGFGSFDLNNRASVKNVGDPIADGAKQWAFNNGQANRTQIDLIDNGFKMPKMWRSTLAVDKTVRGYKFTVEGIYTKTLRDLKFQQINIVEENPIYFSYDKNKEMPIYSGQRINTNLSNAYLLSNTNQGWRYQLTGSVRKDYKWGGNLYLAYTYGKSKDLTNGIRNSMESNWTLNQSLTPNVPKLAWSNFDTRHRIVGQFTWRAGKTQISTVTNAQSGVPFTWGLINTTLANTPQAAGLAYIFKDLAEAKQYIPNGTEAEEFMAFVDSDSYLKSRKGGFTERNGGRTPWSVTADMKLAREVGKRVQFTADIMNLTNLLNTNWGETYFISNSFNSTAAVGLTRTNSGLADPRFTFKKPGTKPYTVDRVASSWQIQIGLRVGI